MKEAARCVRTPVLVCPRKRWHRDLFFPDEPVVVDQATDRAYQGCVRGQTGPEIPGLTEARATASGLPPLLVRG